MAARTGDSYVLNSPYKFVDPLGLISQNAGSPTGTCYQCVDGSAFRGTDTSLDQLKTQTQQQPQNLYVFVGLPLDQQGFSITDAKGKKVDVVKPIDFEKLKETAKAAGINLIIRTWEEATATVKEFQDALRDENAVGVFFYGHSIDDLDASPTTNGRHQSGGLHLFAGYYNENTKITNVSAAMVGIFICDGSSSAKLFQTGGKHSIIALDGGDDGETEITAGGAAVIAAVEATIAKKTPSEITLKANTALKEASKRRLVTASNGKQYRFAPDPKRMKNDKVVMVQ